MAKKSWGDLTPTQRKTILASAAIEATLKSAALVDLARRPRSQVRGPKVLWAVGISIVNGFGIAPAVYFLFGRRRSQP